MATQEFGCAREKLIHLVEKNPILYDKSLRSYLDPAKKEQVWSAIAKELNLESGFDFFASTKLDLSIF